MKKENVLKYVKLFKKKNRHHNLHAWTNTINGKLGKMLPKVTKDARRKGQRRKLEKKTECKVLVR